MVGIAADGIAGDDMFGQQEVLRTTVRQFLETRQLVVCNARLSATRGGIPFLSIRTHTYFSIKLSQKAHYTVNYPIMYDSLGKPFSNWTSHIWLPIDWLIVT